MDKIEEYTRKVLQGMNDMFQEDSEAFIDINEFKEGENLTNFFTAYLKAITFIFNHFTSENKNILEMTHVLNQLAVQHLLELKEEEK